MVCANENTGINYYTPRNQESSRSPNKEDCGTPQNAVAVPDLVYKKKRDGNLCCRPWLVTLA